VWDENGTQNYQAVWHFGAPGSLSLNDSTNNGNNLSGTSDSGASGPVGEAVSLTDGLAAGGSSTFNYTTQSFTLSTWYNPSSWSSNTNVLFYKGAWESDGYYMAMGSGALCLCTSQSGVCQNSCGGASFSLSTWYKLDLVRNGSSVKTYLNGTDITSSSATHINPTSSSDTFYLGTYHNTGSPTVEAPGMYDETSIAVTNRSASWIASEYANQNAPGSFITPSGSPVSNFIP
jgi:hypothetical protein